jgi:hypothetical protein
MNDSLKWNRRASNGAGTLTRTLFKSFSKTKLKKQNLTRRTVAGMYATIWQSRQ